MIRYELAGADLSEVRFAISPLNELTLSLRALRDPGRFPLHLPWLRAVDAADLDRETLLALTNERLWTPDFLNPRPRNPLARLEEELEVVAATPAHRVSADLDAVHFETAIRPAVLNGRPQAVLRRVLAALRGYWEACFEPHWQRMRAVLEADIVHRGRTIVHSGMATMFADISPRVALADDLLTIRLTTSKVDYRRTTAGIGLTLVPTLFSLNPSTPISADEPPVMFYPARGLGTLWNTDRPRAPQALRDLIGETRSGLLRMLEAPASSTELAVRLGVTAAAVNQHLRAMRAAGLLTSARHGRSVLYLRSDLGDRFIEAAR
jgi:DNA-binding transcriptional ArsR family regulator